MIVSGRIIDIKLGGVISCSQISLLLFGISTAFFITASQLFLQAKDFDVFSIPKCYVDLLKDDPIISKKGWGIFEYEQTSACRKKETLGRHFYNGAFILMFLGLGFSLIAYNAVIAVIVAVLGIGFEVWQWVGFIQNRRKT